MAPVPYTYLPHRTVAYNVRTIQGGNVWKPLYRIVPYWGLNGTVQYSTVQYGEPSMVQVTVPVRKGIQQACLLMCNQEDCSLKHSPLTFNSQKDEYDRV